MVESLDTSRAKAGAGSRPPQDAGGLAAVADRLRSRRWLLMAAALILAVLALVGDLAWLHAAVGWMALALAAVAIPRDALLPAPAPTVAERNKQIQRQIRNVLEALPDPAIVLGRGGMVLLSNAKAQDQFGRLKAGGDISSIIRNPEFLDAITGAEHGAPPTTVVYSERVPVGRRIAATVAPLPLDEMGEGGADAVLVSFRDLTEEERLAQMRADFIANASHELRTPLASLSGFIETLQGPARDDPEATERFLGIMAKQARRMSRLIDDLLSLSRVEMKAHLVPSTRVDLAETLRHVVDTLDPIAKESKITLKLETPPGAAWVRGERDELVQVFQNLIQNGIKYGHEGGHVWVRLERQKAGRGEGPSIAVSVKDDGPGIAPDHLPRLTERFYRVDVASSREKGGTGLGLAIVKHVLNRHRAQLRIVSEPGQGSTFTAVFDEAERGGSDKEGAA